MERLLTRREAMAYLRISHQTMANLMKTGLPFVRVGRKILIRQSDIDAFLEERLIRPEKPEKKPSRRRS
ncbi:helix-turn-helix domain-containing protein [Candidatus Dependentiae bacterium]|nr:helix-turn-helix domain-containing protein [Candidatus Dependentiae bacterium]